MSFILTTAGLNTDAMKFKDMLFLCLKRYNSMQTRQALKPKISTASRRPALVVVALILTITFAAAPTPSFSANKGMTVSFPVEGRAMSGVLFVPARTPAPAVVVLHTKGQAIEPADVKFAEALAN